MILATAICAIAPAYGCASDRTHAAGVADLPPDARDGYAVFAIRCSKCHSLSRPLDSGIDDDEHWARYVRRMRLQVGSGISLDDERRILVYLHHYSLEQARRKAHVDASNVPPSDAGQAAPLEGDAE